MERYGQLDVLLIVFRFSLSAPVGLWPTWTWFRWINLKIITTSTNFKPSNFRLTLQLSWHQQQPVFVSHWKGCCPSLPAAGFTWSQKALKQKVADGKMQIRMNRRPVIALNFYTVKLRDTHYPLLLIKTLTGSWTEEGGGGGCGVVGGLWMNKYKREMKTMGLFHVCSCIYVCIKKIYIYIYIRHMILTVFKTLIVHNTALFLS